MRAQPNVGEDDDKEHVIVVVIIVLTLLTLAASVPLCGSAKLDAVLYCTAIYQLTAEQVEQCRCVCPVTPFGPV